MAKIDTSGWKEFRFGDLFELNGIKQAKSQQMIPTVEPDGRVPSVPYVVQSRYSNMVSRFVDRQWLIEHNEPPVQGNVLVLGVTLNACSYQPHEFGASQVITARSPHLTFYNGFFLAAVVKKHVAQFDYKEKPGIEKYRSMLVTLPVDASGEPDWAYMDEYMRAVMKESEASFESLRQADGEKHAVDTSGWTEFKLADIFRMNNTKSIVQKDVVPDSGTIPYVTAQAGNNGVMTYIDCPAEWLDEGNCIMIGGKTLTFSYQVQAFCSNDSHNIALHLKDADKASEMRYLFLIAALRGSLYQKYSWGDSISMKTIKDDVFRLPVDTSGAPDWAYIDEYMRAVMNNTKADLSAMQSIG